LKELFEISDIDNFYFKPVRYWDNHFFIDATTSADSFYDKIEHHNCWRYRKKIESSNQS